MRIKSYRSDILNENKIILGISNLHQRFGHTSIMQYLSAIHYNYIFGLNGIVIPLASVAIYSIILFLSFISFKECSRLEIKSSALLYMRLYSSSGIILRPKFLKRDQSVFFEMQIYEIRDVGPELESHIKLGEDLEGSACLERKIRRQHRPKILENIRILSYVALQFL